MYGKPGLARPQFPPLSGTTPAIVLLNGRPWLSSVGLAAVIGQPHTEIVAAIEGMDIGPAFRVQHFRAATLASGARGKGLWITREGFALLSMTWPDNTARRWQPVIMESFDVAMKAVKTPALNPEPAPRVPFWRRLMMWRKPA